MVQNEYQCIAEEYPRKNSNDFLFTRIHQACIFERYRPKPQLELETTDDGNNAIVVPEIIQEQTVGDGSGEAYAGLSSSTIVFETNKTPEDKTPPILKNSQSGPSSSTIVSETHRTPEDKAPPISNSQAGPYSSTILSEVSPNTFNKSLEEICALPKNSEVSGNTKKRHHTSSAVELTSTPYKDELVAKKRSEEESEKSKINKKSKKTKEAIQNVKSNLFNEAKGLIENKKPKQKPKIRHGNIQKKHNFLSQLRSGGRMG
ncbi:hypothetical protein JTB14_026991 [Gonioctena quinquepunctata]|nr:hypothetical protein JTB14_026991 [Gonioctena quinquepunctata]